VGGNPVVYLSFFGNWAPDDEITIYSGGLTGSGARIDDFTFMAPMNAGNYRIRICYVPAFSPVASFWGTQSEAGHAFTELSLKVEDHLVGIAGGGPGGMPAGFGLDQNYPNPFNQGTIIEFSLEKPGDASIVIYNVDGQTVKTLTRSYAEPGSYALTWDGTNDHLESIILPCNRVIK
jgi:hypothetical protein